MIDTLHSTGALNALPGFVLAALVGVFFGIALERAGMASSRKIAAVFYLRDMTVVKMMFTAIVVAAIGLGYLFGLGLLHPDKIYFLETVYGAHVVGGLLLGLGMVMSGWCPGTGVAGLASGRLDALIFLIGIIAGSIGFNEVFEWIRPLHQWKAAGVVTGPELLGVSGPAFVLGMAVVAVLVFAACEAVERARQWNGTQPPFYLSYLAGKPRPEGPEVMASHGTLADTGYYRVSVIFLVLFCLVLLALAAGLFFVEPLQLPQMGAKDFRPWNWQGLRRKPSDQQLLSEMELAKDHVSPKELAGLITSGDAPLLVDLRPASEFNRFHIRGAVNVPAPDLPEYLKPYKNRGIIVLYSNGMTHPAQARNVLRRRGFKNVYILTDGLTGFAGAVLKPASLRQYPVSPEEAQQIQQWRGYFLEGEAAGAGTFDASGLQLPGLVSTQWLADKLSAPGLVVVDTRPQTDWNTSHIPGSHALAVDSLRGNVGGVPSVLLPPSQLAERFGAMGVTRGTMVVLVYGERVQDATLPAAALNAVGHQTYAILDGGFEKWAAEQRPVAGGLPAAQGTTYRPIEGAADSIIGADEVLQHIQKADAVIIDVRPPEYYRGEKAEEPRAGHIPGAVNRPYTEDTVDAGGYLAFKMVDELRQAYSALIPSSDSLVIVHCRTGHQASQTYFVLRHLLGYSNVLLYDGGWTEWAARPDLPVER